MFSGATQNRSRNLEPAHNKGVRPQRAKSPEFVCQYGQDDRHLNSRYGHQSMSCWQR